MARFLMVPIHADVLCLLHSRQVNGSMVDFSRLPYFNGHQDIQANNPYLSENILAKPFQNGNLTLPPGIHLHWDLPDSLSQRHHTKLSSGFPATPNRWLVIRQNDTESMQWIVDSDYLYPPGTEAETGSVCYPLHCDQTSSNPPFRRMGRTLPLTAWLQRNQAGEEYLTDYQQKLTAVGYGDFTFSSFYPNCYSIFGFHDAAPPPLNTNITYTVIGWYRNSADDPLNQITSWDEIHAIYQWMTKDEQALLPEQTIVYGRIQITTTASSENSYKSTPIQVAIGNTATEALAAFLAYTQNDGSEQIHQQLEDQLESLHLLPELSHRQIDTGPKFKEARHTKGFRPGHGGIIWAVNPVSVTSAKADALHAQQQITLPEELAHQLNQLNLAQQSYDQAHFEIISWRQRIFADWYKYMLSAYPEEDERDLYPDIDQIKQFIEQFDLLPLQELEEAAGLLPNQDDLLQAWHSLTTKQEETISPAPSSIANQIVNLGRLVAAALIDLQYIQPTDITDWRTLITDLQGANEPVFNPIKAVLPQTEINEPAKKQVMDHLNQMIADPTLVYHLNFPQSSPEADQLKAQNPITWSAGQNARYNRLLLQAHLPGLARRAAYQLQAVPAPRFWQPNEPVILLSGDATQSPARFNPNNSFECYLCELPDDEPQNHVSTLLEKVETLPSFQDPVKQQPWNPLFLEWEVQLYPTRDSGNLHSNQRVYLPDFITTNYALGENAVDLTLRTDQNEQIQVNHPYHGRSLLSPHAVPTLKKQIDDFLAKQTPGDEFSQQLLKIANQLNQGPPTLAQTLSGFNDALLGHKQTFQLPIADPLGFPEYQAFATTVNKAVGNYNRVAPQPENDFNPIRSGFLRLARLRLVDTFGQFLDIEPDTVFATDVMKTSEQSTLVWLPPRLVQPACLNLRWLAAGHGPGHEKEEDRDDVEMNAHPATSPICGWLLTNDLDGSVMVYNQQGQILGFLQGVDAQVCWQQAVGTAVSTPVANIPNPHLRRVVQYLLNLSEPAFQDFITALDTALANIDPESFAAHQDIALLMGRPLAIVRVSTELKLLGLSAINQDWTTFRQDLHTGIRETDQFTDIKFPIRLGEHRQLNDGLAGYWIEEAPDKLSSAFYAPQSTSLEAEEIITYANQSANTLNLQMSFNDPAQIVTVLVDPRGVVHATTGILPTKTIVIPPDQYAQALQAMSVTFFSAPILTPRQEGEIALPLPKEAGYTWAWVEKTDKNAWHDGAKIVDVNRQARFSGQQEIREGWLRLQKSPANNDANR